MQLNQSSAGKGRHYFSTVFFGAAFVPVFVVLQFDSIVAQTPAPQPPSLAPASDEGQLAIGSFKFPKELTITLFASEPDVANPVAIDVDRRGRVFVCETFRQEVGVEDNREHPQWLNDDLAAQTVEDRIKYILKHEKNGQAEYTEQDDRIRLLEDTNNDGRADKSTVFSDGYNAIEDGTGAGVLAVGDDVFYTNIPHLWKLQDNNDDSFADHRTSLHRGFGVRFAFRGHDLHGLIVGPDGRLYFSVGDRGYNVSPEIKDPTSGAVFSCELDGSDLQVFATGLRNPQELAFDNYGNLFTGDNNSDSGDKARWVYVVPGGDSGWRMYYQYLPDRGPFNREKIWHPYHKDTPAYIVPPIDNIADGPSGLAFYPGTGFSDFFRDRFFLCDFRGAAAASGVRSFRLHPKGAGFEIADMDQTIWNTLATDIDFGPDGKLYLSDWVFGWVGENKGRIYTYHDPAQIDSDAVKQVHTILRIGLEDESDDRLVELLGHDDRRVRMAAQFELVNRKKISLLLDAAGDLDPKINLMRRIHALWGLKQLVLKNGDREVFDDKQRYGVQTGVVEILSDPKISDPEIRAQAVRYGGDIGDPHSARFVARALKDSSPRVRFMAALALEKIGQRKHLPDVVAMLAENKDADPFLRHAGIMAIYGIIGRSLDEQAAIAEELKSHESRSVRLASVVALRKIRSPLIRNYLDDPNPQVVLEAARAIHDLPIPDALNALARLIQRSPSDDALVRRVLNANMIVGQPDNAVALAKFASESTNNVDRRKDALDLLGHWMSPNSRDFVLGDWRPINRQRNREDVVSALETQFPQIVDDGLLAAKAIEVCDATDIKLPAETIQQYVIDKNQSDDLRIAALRMLRKSEDRKFRAVLETLTASYGELTDELAGEVTQQLVSIDPPKALGLLRMIVDSNDVSSRRKQLAYKTLGSMNDKASGELLLQSLEQLKTGHLNAAVWLDVMMAAENRGEDDVARKLVEISQADLNSADKLAPYLSTLYGGDAKSGAKVFFEKTKVSCLRCHVINARGGAVGPELSAIGATKTRRYLLESIIVPNKTIAEGYGQLVVLTDEGLTWTGIKKSETDQELVLMDSDGNLVRINTDNIEDMRQGLSSMPVDFNKQLTLTEIRDLIEFLSSCDPKKNEVPVRH